MEFNWKPSVSRQLGHSITPHRAPFMLTCLTMPQGTWSRTCTLQSPLERSQDSSLQFHHISKKETIVLQQLVKYWCYENCLRKSLIQLLAVIMTKISVQLPVNSVNLSHFHVLVFVVTAAGSPSFGLLKAGSTLNKIIRLDCTGVTYKLATECISY